SPIQNAHDDRGAVDRGQEADAQVEVLAADGHLDAAVLRPPLLGDVDVAHDLDAGRDRGDQPPGRAVPLDQNAVNPVAHPHAVGKCFDVDVAGPKADGFLDHQIDQLHHGGVTLLRGGHAGDRLGFREVD